MFCQECGKIIGYANFQWKKSSAFCAKMGKQRLHFFHAIVSKFMSPMRLAWKTASFLFFLTGRSIRGMSIDGRRTDPLRD
ncbi:hypothetical protein IO10_02895 [Salmonella enterica]|nr:hypothetical protein IO10_02895 [Salmonella enterica]